MSISSPIQPPTQAPPAQPLTSEGTAKAILQNGDAALKNDGQRQIIRGEVTKAERDGTVVVNTDTGEFRVKLPENLPNPPRQGDKVEIQIPPRAPDDPPLDEVTIRVTERAPIDIKAETPPPPRTSETPVQITLEPPAPPPIIEAPPPTDYKPLEPGQTVRLQPLPPALYPDVIVPVPQVIATTEITPAVLRSPQTVQTKIESIDDIPLRPIIVTNTAIKAEFPETAQTLTPETFALKPNTAAPVLPAPPLGDDIKNTPLLSRIPLWGGEKGGEEFTAPQLTNSGSIITITPPAQLTNNGGGTTVVPTIQNTGDTITIVSPTQAQLQPNAVFVPQEQPQTLALSPLTLDKTTLLPLVPAQPPTAAATISLQVESVNPPPTLILKPQEPQPITIKPQDTILIQGAAPQVVVAKVSGFVKNTLPIVSLNTSATPENTAQPLFILHAATSTIEAGTEIILTANPPAITPGMSLHVPLPPYPQMLLTPEGWPVLDQIYQTLTLAAPNAARNMINMTPNPGNAGQMTPAALFFIAAIRTGDLQGWLGDKALESLKHAGKSGLLSRLTQEGGLLSRLAKEPVSQDWKGVPLPMAWQNEIQKTVIYYRHEDEDKQGEERGGKGTRFVMDLNLTRIGKVQLDGFFRDKSFDLILRTTEPFSSSARYAMRGLFTYALESENLKGELGFQNKPETWVKISHKKESYSSQA